ncbi:MAG: 30S ribosomal protein S6 [Desulfobacteraceae bacterium]|jgi:small subunit ribosomal protein S6|nr:30S ribosomal protein S6 [Desulfobacteraceae bacterium]
MQRYETIFIIDPDLSEEGRAPVVERLLQLIPQQNGVLVEEDHWGSRKLAYPIRKKQRGYYLRLDYCGVGALVDELERFCRIDERLLKYMTIKLADDVDVDQVQAEMAERAAAKAAAEAGSVAEDDQAGASTDDQDDDSDEASSEDNEDDVDEDDDEDKE